MYRDELTLPDIFRALWKRKYQIAGITLVVFLLVATVTFTTPRAYVSDAAFFVRLGPENARLDVTTTMGNAPEFVVPLERKTEINSIAELMRSRELLESVVDDLGVDLVVNEGIQKKEKKSGVDKPGLFGSIRQLLVDLGISNQIDKREKAIIKVRKRLQAWPVANSNVIRVEYKSHDPEFSKRVLEKLVTAYIAFHAKIHRTQGATAFLQDQVETIRSLLREQEAELDDLKQSANLFASDDQRKLMAERVANLERQLDEALAIREANLSEVTSLRSRLVEIPESKPLETTTGAGNEGVDGMQQRFYDLQLEYERTRALYSADHPTAIQIAKQLENAKEILALVESARTETVSGPNEVYDAIRTDLIRKEALLKAAESRIESLESSLSDLDQKMDEFVEFERQHNELVREISVNEVTFTNYASNLEQARIDQALESERLSNLIVVQSPTLNTAPTSPNKKLNLAAGLLLGVLLGCSFAVVREWFAPRPAEPDSPGTPELPVVARVPRVQGPVAQDQPVEGEWLTVQSQSGD